MFIGPPRPLTACLFVFGTEPSHTRSSQSEYARGTHPTVSRCECPLHTVTATSLPPPASSCPFSGPCAFLEAVEASPEQSPVTHIQALPCASTCAWPLFHPSPTPPCPLRPANDPPSSSFQGAEVRDSEVCRRSKTGSKPFSFLLFFFPTCLLGMGPKQTLSRASPQ